MLGDGLLLLLAAGDGLRFPLAAGDGLRFPLAAGEGLLLPLEVGEGLRLPLLLKSALLLVSPLLASLSLPRSSPLLVSMSLPRSFSRLALLFLATGDLLRDFFLQKNCEPEAKIKATVQKCKMCQKDHLASLFLPTVVTTEALFAQACRSAGTGPSLSDTGS